MKKFRGNSIFCAGYTWGKKREGDFFEVDPGERKEEIELGFHYSKKPRPSFPVARGLKKRRRKKKKGKGKKLTLGPESREVSSRKKRKV